MPLPQPGDVVLLISPDRKRFVLRLTPGEQLHTHRGIINHDDVLAQQLGSGLLSHTGHRFTVLQPSIDETLMSLRRATQIVYPKEIGYILLKLSITPGRRVIEAGSGSGVLTAALARYVSPDGHIYSYEARPDMINLARANVDRVGLADVVTFHLQSIEVGFEEREVDAVFLDVREPWLYLEQSIVALTDGAFFGAIVPTVNQLVDLVTALTRRATFTDVEIDELMLRQYKPVPERLRPMDRLTAHTGYLVFARKLALGSYQSPESGLPSEPEAE
jgi:tRNA (adenine57-N1/adenine58-N1)-methyltransferase catalytic subunit